jgi:hypothetical protein
LAVVSVSTIGRIGCEVRGVFLISTLRVKAMFKRIRTVMK